MGIFSGNESLPVPVLRAFQDQFFRENLLLEDIGLDSISCVNKYSQFSGIPDKLRIRKKYYMCVGYVSVSVCLTVRAHTRMCATGCARNPVEGITKLDINVLSFWFPKILGTFE